MLSIRDEVPRRFDAERPLELKNASEVPVAVVRLEESPRMPSRHEEASAPAPPDFVYVMREAYAERMGLWPIPLLEHGTANGIQRSEHRVRGDGHFRGRILAEGSDHPLQFRVFRGGHGSCGDSKGRFENRCEGPPH